MKNIAWISFSTINLVLYPGNTSELIIIGIFIQSLHYPWDKGLFKSISRHREPIRSIILPIPKGRTRSPSINGPISSGGVVYVRSSQTIPIPFPRLRNQFHLDRIINPKKPRCKIPRRINDSLKICTPYFNPLSNIPKTP